MACKQDLTSEQVRQIVRDEMRNREYDNYIISLITRTDLDSRVRDLVERNLKSVVDQCVGKAISDYNKYYLPDKIRSNLTTMMKELLPTMIKGEILEKLGHLSGINTIMEEYRTGIQSELHQQTQSFYQTMTEQLQQISGIRDRQIQEFNIQARQLAVNLVKELVASNGNVIQGFKDELARQNLANFITTKTDAMGDITRLKEKCKRLEESLSTQQWISVGLTFGLLSCVSMVVYVVMNK